VFRCGQTLPQNESFASESRLEFDADFAEAKSFLHRMIRIQIFSAPTNRELQIHPPGNARAITHPQLAEEIIPVATPRNGFNVEPNRA